MKTKVTAQLVVAINVINDKIPEFHRIGLILLDNIVENVIKNACLSKLQYYRTMSKIESDEYDLRVKNLHNYYDMLVESTKCALITCEEKEILLYCHKARNISYHHFSEHEAKVNFSIGYLCRFTSKNLLKLLKGFIAIVVESKEKRESVILANANVKSFDELLGSLHSISQDKTYNPEFVFADILFKYVNQIEDEFDTYGFKTWQEFNEIVKSCHSSYVKDKTYKGFKSLNYTKQYYNFDLSKSEKYIKKLNTVKNMTIDDSFSYYSQLFTQVEPVFIGLRTYISNQEYAASIDGS